MVTDAIAPGLLLAAAPLGDPNFGRSVVLIAQHGEDGALGWVINGQQIVAVSQLLRDAGLTPQDIRLPDTPSYRAKVRVGGPVSPRSAWLLYRRSPQFEHAAQLTVSDHWAVSGAKDIVQAIALARGPDEFLLLLGYAGWAPGQLEQEIGAGAWLPVPINEEFVFALSVENLWETAYTRLVGVSPYAFLGLRPGSA